MRRVLLIALSIVLVGACSGGGKSAAKASSSNGSGPAAPAATNDLPAGMQYLDKAEALPAGLEIGGASAAKGDTVVVVGSHGVGTSGAFGAVRTGTSWEGVTIDDGTGLTGPPGLSFTQTGPQAGAVVAGPNGFVAGGLVQWLDGPRFVNRNAETAFTWQSADGRTWTRTDLRTVFGDDTASVVGPIVATNDGYLAAASVGPLDLHAGPSHVVVIGSPDGVTWTKKADLAEPWSMVPSKLVQLGTHLLLTNIEFVCDASGAHFGGVAVGGQLKLARSDDGGATWTPLDAAALGVVPKVEAPPADASACPPETSNEEMQAVNQRFASGVGDIVIGGTTAIAIASDKSTASLSTDLSTWTPITIPGLAPTVSKNTAADQFNRKLFSDNGTLTLLSLESRRTAKDEADSIGDEVIGWQSKDAGKTWTRLASAPALFIGQGLAGTLQPLSDGTVLLLTESGAVFGTQAAARVSRSGPRIDTTKCQPAKNAVCNFAFISTDLTGKDLSGADFEGANLEEANLTGANLTDARLDGADVPSTFANATLTGSSLRFIDIHVGEQPLAGSGLGGVDLSGAQFDGSGPGIVTADFSGTNLSNTTWSGTNLTGANFAGANLEGIRFSFNVTCPDGQPFDETKLGKDACRL